MLYAERTSFSNVRWGTILHPIFYVHVWMIIPFSPLSVRFKL